MDAELRALEDKPVTLTWKGLKFKIEPKPLSQIDRVAEEMDKIVVSSAENVGMANYFTKMLKNKRKETIDRLRFFITMPPEATDEWMAENLTIPMLVKFDEVIAEVNQLEYIGNFFGLPGLKTTKEKSPVSG